MVGQQMHTNSLAAYSQEKPKLDERKETILNAVRELGGMTDREVCTILGFNEMNAVRPRITELVADGRLIEVRRVKCGVTGKTVRMVNLPNIQVVPIA